MQTGSTREILQINKGLRLELVKKFRKGALGCFVGEGHYGGAQAVRAEPVLPNGSGRNEAKKAKGVGWFEKALLRCKGAHLGVRLSILAGLSSRGRLIAESMSPPLGEIVHLEVDSKERNTKQACGSIAKN